FALHASDSLTFGKGLSDVDDPDLWQRDLTGAIDLWIEVGQPDDRTILKACGRAAHVLVYAYSPSALLWWKSIADRMERARHRTEALVPCPYTSTRERGGRQQLHIRVADATAHQSMTLKVFQCFMMVGDRRTPELFEQAPAQSRGHAGFHMQFRR